MINFLMLLEKVNFLENQISSIKADIQAQLKNHGWVDIEGELERLLIKASKHGATIRDLRKNSRALQKLDKATIAQALSQMMARGNVVLREMPTPSGRGRKRIAYVWVAQHA